MEKINVATGEIIIVEASSGKLELVSLQDYGKAKNIKANFLGLPNEINKVPHGDLLPLTEKWVVTLSTQYGCSMNCIFCDVPKVGSGRNATYEDLKLQLLTAIEEHPEVTSTKRLNIHYARMGEPTWNTNVLLFTHDIKEIINPYLNDSLVHPVISTMLPKNNKNLHTYLNEWTYIKNHKFNGDAGLQFSINSTDEEQRTKMFSNNALSLKEIAKLGELLEYPKGRKYTLNFAIADNFSINAKLLSNMFDPKKFMVKITPIHATKTCAENGIQTSNGYFDYSPYREIENDLITNGFDVIVFIPSIEEDKSRITCGNAILSQRT